MPTGKGLAVLRKRFGLSSREEEFLNGRYVDDDMSTAARNISEFYLSKTTERTKASERLSSRLLISTAALVFIALAQLVAYLVYAPRTGNTTALSDNLLQHNTYCVALRCKAALVPLPFSMHLRIYC